VEGDVTRGADAVHRQLPDTGQPEGVAENGGHILGDAAQMFMAPPGLPPPDPPPHVPRASGSSRQHVGAALALHSPRVADVADVDASAPGFLAPGTVEIEAQEKGASAPVFQTSRVCFGGSSANVPTVELPPLAPPPPPPGPARTDGRSGHHALAPPASELLALATVSDPGTRSVLWVPVEGSTRLQLCLRCEGKGVETLLQNASNLVLQALSVEHQSAVTAADGLQDAVLNNYLQAQQGWQDAISMRMTAAAGPFAGTSAIGTGPNVKLRTRVAKLALAVAVATEFPSKFGEDMFSHCNPCFRDFVNQATQFKNETGIMTTAALPRTLSRPPAPPVPESASRHASIAATSFQEALLDRERPVHRDLIEEARHELAVFKPGELSSGAIGAPPPSTAIKRLPVSQGVPVECMQDRFMELRPWDAGSSGSLWPYCLLCNCWSDSAHINGQKHTKRLLNAGYASTAASPQQWWTTQTASPPVGQGPPTALFRGLRGGTEPEHLLALPAPAYDDFTHPRLAPDVPTSDEIYRWNLPFVTFKWDTVEGLSHD